MSKIDINLNPEQKSLLVSIKDDSALRTHFFARISHLRWFYDLKAEGYFKPENAPLPKPAGPKGYFTIPEWEILPYLEKISKDCIKLENKEYADELIRIIKEVTNYQDDNNTIKDNYRTWWYFAKILVNLNTADIPVETLSSIRKWFDSKYNNSLLSEEVTANLLPKFLVSSSPGDIEKAEIIISILTDFKEVRFDDENSEYQCVVEPFWLIDSFIDKGIAEKIGQYCTPHIVILLAEKLKLLYRQEHSIEKYFNTDEPIPKYYRMRFIHVSDYEYKITLEQLEAKSDADNTPIMFRKAAKGAILFSSDSVKCESSSDFEVLTKHCIEMMNQTTQDTFRLSEEDIAQIYEGIWIDYSDIWIPILGQWKERHANRADEVLTIILAALTLSMVRSNTEKMTKIFSKFQSHNFRYPIFRRIIVYIYDICFDLYQYQFGEYLKHNSLFNDNYIRNELYLLLENHAKGLSQDIKKEIEKQISKGPLIDVMPKPTEKQISAWKQWWYSSLRSNPEFDELYINEKNITGKDSEIEFRESHTRWGPGPSPIGIEEIVKMQNSILANYLLQFRTIDSWKGPTTGGLAEALENATKYDPLKFVSDLSPFMDLSYYYLYHILKGLKESGKTRFDIDWIMVIEFLFLYTNRAEFWNDSFITEDDDGWHSDHRWIVGISGEIIEQILADDNRLPEIDFILKVKELIFYLGERIKTDVPKSEYNPISLTLNSAYGKILMAIIPLIYRRIKLEGISQNDDLKWLPDEKAFYLGQVKKGTIESFTLFGRHLPTFYYFDKEWVTKQLLELSKLTDEMLWSAFMYGYLSIQIRGRELFNLMQDNYIRAINGPTLHEGAEQLLISHIFAGYLRYVGDEAAGNLYVMVIKEWNIHRINFIVTLISNTARSLKDQESGPFKERIINTAIQFWRISFDKYHYEDIDILSDDKKGFLANLLGLMPFLQKIDDENIRWITLSASCVNIGFNEHFILEYLDKIKNENDLKIFALYVAQILKAMTNNYILSYYNKHFFSLIEYIFTSGNRQAKGLANEICNSYVEKNSPIATMMAALYNKYN
jgi:hypothetical protein